MKEKLVVILFAISTCLTALSQKDTLYFTKDEIPCSKEDAAWLRYSKPVDANSEVYEVTQKWIDGKIKLQGFYLSNISGYCTGKFTEYFSNGQIQSTGIYFTDKAKKILSRKQGRWEMWYESGLKKSEINYELDRDGKSLLVEVLNAWDSTGKQIVLNGEGNYSYTEMVKLLSLTKYVTYSGPIKKSFFDGEWISRFSDGTIYTKDYFHKGIKYESDLLFTEYDIKCIKRYFDNGDFTKGVSFDSAGKRYPFKTLFISPMQYPGGDLTLMNFLKQKIVYPKYEQAHGIEGRVVLRLQVDGKGNVADIKLDDKATDGLAEEAVRVAKKLKFIPGQMYGVPTGGIFRLPVTFKLH